MGLLLLPERSNRNGILLLCIIGYYGVILRWQKLREKLTYNAQTRQQLKRLILVMGCLEADEAELVGPKSI